MGLLCQRCGHRGGADLSFMWFAKRFTIQRKKDGVKREKTLWLCPDCQHEVGGEKKCTAFLRELVKE